MSSGMTCSRPANRSQGLGGLEQRQAAARLNSQRQVGVAAGGGRHSHNILLQRVIHMHIPHLLLQQLRSVPIDHFFETGDGMFAPQD